MVPLHVTPVDAHLTVTVVVFLANGGARGALRLTAKESVRVTLLALTAGLGSAPQCRTFEHARLVG